MPPTEQLRRSSERMPMMQRILDNPFLLAVPRRNASDGSLSDLGCNGNRLGPPGEMKTASCTHPR